MFEVSKHSLFRLKITVGRRLCAYPSIHFSLDEDTLKITVGCLTSAYPSVHKKNSQDHGRLPAVHISKHSPFSWCWNSQDHGRLPDKHKHISKHSQQKLRQLHGLPWREADRLGHRGRRHLPRLVDDGIDLELIREPVVASRFSLAHAGAVVTVRNGILQDTVLALHLVTNIAVLLLRVDHDAWRFGPVDDRRELHARSIITSKFSVERAAAVVSDDC